MHSRDQSSVRPVLECNDTRNSLIYINCLIIFYHKAFWKIKRTEFTREQVKMLEEAYEQRTRKEKKMIKWSSGIGREIKLNRSSSKDIFYTVFS